MEHQGIILIMDYDTDVSVMMEETLLSEGYAVRRCSREQVGIEAVEAVLPDMVIVDLPRIGAGDTLAMLECLRQRATTRDVAVLVTSTDSRLLCDLAGPLRALGCFTLGKPFDLDDFLALVAHSSDRACEVSGAADGAWL